MNYPLPPDHRYTRSSRHLPQNLPIRPGSCPRIRCRRPPESGTPGRLPHGVGFPGRQLRRHTAPPSRDRHGRPRLQRINGCTHAALRPGHERRELSRAGNSAIDGFGVPQDCPPADVISTFLNRCALDQIDRSPKQLLQRFGKAEELFERRQVAALSNSTRKSKSLRFGSKSSPRAAEPNTSSRATP